MDAFIGEIRPFAFGYVPEGWLACDGQAYNVSQYQALASIVGNKFGGSWPQTFKVPNLPGFVVLGVGQGPGLTPYHWGDSGGATTVALNSAQFPAHTHNFFGATGNPTTRTATPTGAYMGNFNTGSAAVPVYSATANVNVVLDPHSITVGGTATAPVPHNNQSPSLAMIYCINVDGVYPVNPQ